MCIDNSYEYYLNAKLHGIKKNLLIVVIMINIANTRINIACTYYIGSYLILYHTSILLEYNIMVYEITKFEL